MDLRLLHSGQGIRVKPQVLLASWVTGANCALGSVLCVSLYHLGTAQGEAEGALTCAGLSQPVTCMTSCQDWQQDTGN